jgi:hypothetical protein
MLMLACLATIYLCCRGTPGVIFRKGRSRSDNLERGADDTELDLLDERRSSDDGSISASSLPYVVRPIELMMKRSASNSPKLEVMGRTSSYKSLNAISK